MSAIFTEQEIAEFGLDVPDESEVEVLVDEYLTPSSFGLFAITYGINTELGQPYPIGCYCNACADTQGSTYDTMCLG